MNYIFQVILLLVSGVLGHSDHSDHSHHEHTMLPTGLRCKNVERKNKEQNLRILNGHETDWNWPFIVRLGMKDEGKCSFTKDESLTTGPYNLRSVYRGPDLWTVLHSLT